MTPRTSKAEEMLHEVVAAFRQLIVCAVTDEISMRGVMINPWSFRDLEQVIEKAERLLRANEKLMEACPKCGQEVHRPPDGAAGPGRSWRLICLRTPLGRKHVWRPTNEQRTGSRPGRKEQKSCLSITTKGRR